MGLIARFCNQHHQGSGRLFKTGEVKEIAVMPIRKIAISIACLFGGRSQNHYPATCFGLNNRCQAITALLAGMHERIVRVRTIHLDGFRIDLVQLSVRDYLHPAMNLNIFHRRFDD